MESFFQVAISFDEIELLELIAQRYTSIEFILQLTAEDFLRFVKRMLSQIQEERIRRQWETLLPYMSIGYLKYTSFSDYKAQCTGENIDQRPADEIIAEIKELHGME